MYATLLTVYVRTHLQLIGLLRLLEWYRRRLKAGVRLAYTSDWVNKLEATPIDVLSLCRVFCAKFSGDATYVLTGSDDTNIRIWKAKASEQLGVVRILDPSPQPRFADLFCLVLVRDASEGSVTNSNTCL